MRTKSGVLFLSCFVAALVFGLTAFFWGGMIHAADGIYITYNGEDLNASDVYPMTTGSMQLTMRTDGTAYDSDQYIVEWDIADSQAKDVIASIEQDPNNKMIAIVRALSPGDVTITLTVKDHYAGDAVMGTTTCNISVQFSIDTTVDDSIFKYVNTGDTDRSLVLYSDSNPVSLQLSFGDSDSAQWTSANTEICTVTQNGGVLTPVGAGATTVTATYTPVGALVTHTAYLKVYVIPKVSTTNGSGYATTQTVTMTSGEYLYTDTVFTNNLETEKNKVTWVIRQDNSAGDSVVIADSLGTESDLISITPTASRSNQLQVEGVAGEYDIYFYTKGTYDESVDNGTLAYTPTVVHLVLESAIEDKEVILNVGDTYNLATAYNMTVEDFNTCFSVTHSLENGSTDAQYVSYDSSNLVFTAKKVGTVVVNMKVKSGKATYLKKIMGLDADDSLPSAFVTTLKINDSISLNVTSLTISKGQTYQLSVNLHGTYSGTVTWTTSDKNYVTVDENGLITGVKATTSDVVITATLDTGDAVGKSAECYVKVEETISKVTIQPSELTMSVGETEIVTASFKGTVSIAPLEWSSSDEKVFTIEASADAKTAVVTAKGAGEATITVYNTANGEFYYAKVTVVSPIETIEFKESEITDDFYKGNINLKDHVTYTPTKATATELVWSTSNAAVATVDSDGYVTYVGAGSTLITVYPAYNPNLAMAQMLLTVVGVPTSMDLDQSNITLNVGAVKYINFSFAPEGTAATVNVAVREKSYLTATYNSGKKQATITGKAPGTTDVTFTTPNGLSATIYVTVLQPSSGIVVTPSEVTITTGQTYQLDYKLTPANSTDTVTWSSLNGTASIASVDSKGLITGLKEGTAYIQAQAFNGKTGGSPQIVVVTVKEGLQGVTLDATTQTVAVGSTVKLTPIFNPANAYNKNMTWSSGDASVAKVEGTSTAKVTGVKEGYTVITGISEDGGYKVYCLVTVVAAQTESDTKVTLKPKKKFLKLKKSFYIKATVTGSSNKKVKWKSSNKKVASVTKGGKVKGKKIGTAYITATAKDGSGAYARCKVRVVRKVTKIKLNRYSAKILIGTTTKLKATIKPKNATIRKVTWKSSNPYVATVSSSGRVVGIAPGTAKIIATAKDGSKKKATCYVTVIEPVDATGVTVANSQITLAKGKSAMSGIVAEPVNTTTSIRYYSDNRSVATVDSKGKIRTKRAGQATIYGETANGKVGYVEVLVVDLNRKGMTIRQYDTEQLYVNEIDTGVTWYSKNSTIATVSQTGLVTGKRKGTTTVYAVINGVKLGCRVKVKKIK